MPSTTSRVFGAKPASSTMHRVRAGPEVGDGVIAFAVGDVRPDRAGCLAGDRDGHARQRALTLVEHAPGDTGFGLLGQRESRDSGERNNSAKDSESFHDRQSTQHAIRRYDGTVNFVKTRVLRSCNDNVTIV